MNEKARKAGGRRLGCEKPQRPGKGAHEKNIRPFFFLNIFQIYLRERI